MKLKTMNTNELEIFKLKDLNLIVGGKYKGLTAMLTNCSENGDGAYGPCEDFEDD